MLGQVVHGVKVQAEVIVFFKPEMEEEQIY